MITGGQSSAGHRLKRRAARLTRHGTARPLSFTRLRARFEMSATLTRFDSIRAFERKGTVHEMYIGYTERRAKNTNTGQVSSFTEKLKYGCAIAFVCSSDFTFLWT